MKQDGWLRDPKNHWSLRFHIDKNSWINQQFILVDHDSIWVIIIAK